jgi:hypothetical protein
MVAHAQRHVSLEFPRQAVARRGRNTVIRHEGWSLCCRNRCAEIGQLVKVTSACDFEPRP